MTFAFRKVVQRYLVCGEMFKYEYVANLPLSLSAKEFWKYG